MSHLPPIPPNHCELLVATNPFRPSRERYHFRPTDAAKQRRFSGHPALIDEQYPLTTIERLVARHLPRAKFPVTVLLDGLPVPREQWPHVVPQPGSRLLLCQVPGDDFGGILRIAAMILLAVGGAWIAAGNLAFMGGAFLGEAFFSGGIGAIAAASAFTIGGGMIVNALLPPKAPAAPKLGHDGGESANVSWSGPRTTQAVGIPIARIGGEFQTGGNIISAYRSSDGENQYLHMLIALGRGPFAGARELLINGIRAEQYRDVEVEIRYGTPKQSVIPNFAAQITDYGYDNEKIVAVNPGESFKQYPSRSRNCTKLEVDLTFAALYSVNSDDGDDDYGEQEPYSVTVQLHYRRITPGGNYTALTDWQPFLPLGGLNAETGYAPYPATPAPGPDSSWPGLDALLVGGQVVRGFTTATPRCDVIALTAQLNTAAISSAGGGEIKVTFKCWAAPVGTTDIKPLPDQVFNWTPGGTNTDPGINFLTPGWQERTFTFSAGLDATKQYNVFIYIDSVANARYTPPADEWGGWGAPSPAAVTPKGLDSKWRLTNCVAKAASGQYTISAERYSRFWRTFTTPALLSGRYETRVIRVSPNHEGNPYIFDVFYLTSIREFVDEPLRQPGLGLLGLKMLATDQLSGGQPNVTVIPQPIYWDWRTVDVEHPNGTVGTSLNPALIGYQALTGDEVIFPEITEGFPLAGPNAATWFRSSEASQHGYPQDEYAINPNRIVWDAWTALADRCAQQIDRGDGTLADRHTFRGILDTRSNRWDWCCTVLAQALAVPMLLGTRITVVVPWDCYAVQKFDHSNMIRSTFRRRWLPKQAGWITIQYTDPDTWATVPVSVVGDNGGAPATEQAIGCANEWEAIRLGYHRYYDGQLRRWMASFQAPVEMVGCLPGDVVEVWHAVAKRGPSGRLQGVAGGGLTLTLDQTVTLEAGHEWHVKVKRSTDDALLDYLVTNALPATTDTLTVVARKTIRVNQQQLGGEWVYLGSFPFAVGTAGYVQLTDDVDEGYVIADAVRFVHVQDSSIEVVIDDKDTASGAFTGGGGGWVQQVPSVPEAYAQTWPQNDAARTNRYHAAGNGSAWARWTPTITEPGMYHVFCWYSSGQAGQSNRAVDSPYTVVFDGSGAAGKDSYGLYHPTLKPLDVLVYDVAREADGRVNIVGIEHNELIEQLTFNSALRNSQPTIPHPQAVQRASSTTPTPGRLVSAAGIQDPGSGILPAYDVQVLEMRLPRPGGALEFVLQIFWRQRRTDYGAIVYQKNDHGGWDFLSYGMGGVELRGGGWSKGRTYTWCVCQVGGPNSMSTLPGNKAGFPPYSPEVSYTLIGKGLAPDDVTGLRAISNGDSATLMWARNPAADQVAEYLVEARLNQSPAYGGTAAPYREVRVTGTSTVIDTPWAGTYYFDVWAIDDLGIKSEAAASTYVIVSEAWAANVIYSQDIDPADGVTWTYHGSVCIADDGSIRRPSIAGSSALGPFSDPKECDFQNFGSGLADVAGADLASVPGTWFSDMILTKAANYAESAVIDLGSQLTGYFHPIYRSELINYAVGTNWDDVGGEYLANRTGEELSAQAGEISVVWYGGNTLVGGVITDEQVIEAGQVAIRYLRCRINYNLPSYVMEGRVWDLAFSIDVPDLVESGTFTTSGVAGEVVSFTKTFHAAPAVVITPEAGGAVTLDAGSITITQFTVTSAAPVTFHWAAQKY
jgi:hypothetical protein